MRVFHLPNGRVINPAHVKRVTIEQQWWGSSPYDVQLEMKNGDTEDIAENLTQADARKLQQKYVRIIQDAYEDSSAYDQGVDDGREQGHADGYSAGYRKGKEDTYAEAYESAARETRQRERERLLSYLYESRENFLREQRDPSHKEQDRKRYLRHAIAVLSDLIDRFSA